MIFNNKNYNHSRESTYMYHYLETYISQYRVYNTLY